MPRRKITLETVVKNFHQWRATKKIGERIPEYLWRQVIQVVPQNKLGFSLNALGISSAQYRQHVPKTLATTAAKPSPTSATKAIASVRATQFVPVAATAVISPAITTPTLIFRRADGARIDYHCPPFEVTQSLLKAFFGDN